MSTSPEKLPDFVADLAECTAQAISAELELNEQEAARVGEAVAQHFCDLYGGCQIYVPVSFVLKLSERDQQIFDEFDGKNHSTLARKYGCSERAIYSILRRVRAKRNSPNQIGFTF